MNALPCNSDASVAGEPIQLNAKCFTEAVFELGLPILIESKYFVIVGDGLTNYVISED